MVFNVELTREWLSREDTSGLTASQEDAFYRQQSMHMRDDISWFWMFPAHSFIPTCHLIKMVKKG